MFEIPDEPTIAMALETGYPYQREPGLHCEKCDHYLPEESDEPYYEVNGHIYCRECMEGMMHYA